MYIITDRCVCCYTCEADCQAKAISEHESGERLEIDQSLCRQCGHCADICPMKAIIHKA